ncbi:diacylglycerol kinase family lipid kinase [Apibacter muscae]|uniref:diacylglycerol/lipid kinase family protein n=1 Tax=Apibacter muscae TaxID=2509004 RepID=UPI0011AD1972|nr:diacylglycerol kinase family protein [Apibacter muscae]TWP22910.1 diacylglycerol kinase family lipid kinase [Apibacter muscae]
MINQNKIIYFIVNPISGGGKGKLIVEYIKNKFLDYISHIHVTTQKGDAHAFTKLAIENNASCVVSCGGDGTLNEVASALVGSHIPLAIVPIGSGNGLARHLKIPLSYTKALDLILNSKKYIETIDVGKVNENYFFSNTGIGFDAETIGNYSNQKTRKLIGYLKSIVLSIRNFKPVIATIKPPNHQYSGEIMMLNISNSNCMGYNFSICPKASLKDGWLDVNIVKKSNWLAFLWIGIGYLLHLDLGKNRIQLKVKELELNTSSNVMQIDGEYLSLNSSSLKINIIPKALKILVG